MSYDQPQRVTYSIPSGAFGATTAAHRFVGPQGKVGIVRDISLTPTADFVGTTTVPEIAVGAASSGTDYARWRLGTAVGTGYTSAQGPRRARSLVTGNPTPPVLSDFAGHVALETARIPADTGFYITGIQGVGGTPAGTARYEVEIDWY